MIFLVSIVRDANPKTVESVPSLSKRKERDPKNMENSPSSSRGRARFSTQANALLRKNLTFQKRNAKTNGCIIMFPLILCIILITIQIVVNNELNKPGNKCGCLGNQCGIEYSNTNQAALCAILHPPKWPALLQVPRNVFRAVQSGSTGHKDLPVGSCKVKGSCPATVLFTGGNKSFAEGLANNFFPVPLTLNLSNYLDIFSTITTGTQVPADYTEVVDPAFISESLYILQPICSENTLSSTNVNLAGIVRRQEIECVQGLPLWRHSTSEMNDEIYTGYHKGNSEGKINEFIAAYDFQNSRENRFSVNIWYNSTYNRYSAFNSPALVRVSRSVNLASNAYLKFAKGSDIMMQFEYVKEMPQPERQIRLDFSSILGPLFFTWVIQLLFPVVLSSVVYEKEKKLRIMMKMHGLKDGPYWIISYAYFFSLSIFYMLCFVIFGSLIGLKFFTLNSYSIQILFYFIYINLQIALAFLVSAFFSYVKTATVVAYLYVFGTGLLGNFLLRFFIEDSSFPKAWIIVMELIPGFSLYRGLYEFAHYAFSGNLMGTEGMKWGDIKDHDNGMEDALVIMVVEWIVLLLISYCLDRVSLSGGGNRRSCLFFLQYFQKRKSLTTQRSILQRDSSKVDIEMDRPDVVQEREVVEKLIQEPNNNYAMICDNLKKIYPGKDGNPSKFAVRGLSLALPRGECFGMLGPNGAGKTSFINMMIGLTSPTYGTAFVQGLDIRTSMEEIYSSMGVCPQHDLLWETLTGKEHLLFYGRLKNLKGAALMQAVDDMLKSVNLFYGGVGNKKAGQYSGGMKRRLSVAISLIGDPKVVYMDEPSTGLDPASRNNLWTVVKKAKADRAIILTTHSMEEAEFLCDRLGIFVDGSLQCIGNPNELKGRYGGNYIFTVTTSADKEEEVEHLVRKLSPSAKRIYHVSNTQKFEMPKQEVRIAEVFRAIDIAKGKLNIYAWGLVDTTLEDVFIKVAKGAESFEML